MPSNPRLNGIYSVPSHEWNHWAMDWAQVPRTHLHGQVFMSSYFMRCHETLPPWREATNGPHSDVFKRLAFYHQPSKCALLKETKKNTQKPSLGPLVSARHIKSSQWESLVFFRWSIAIWSYIVIHHILRILLHGKTLGITMLQRLANSHQLTILHAEFSHHSLKSPQMVRLHHSNSCDPCRGCSSLATGCSGKHPYEPQNIKRIQKIHFTHKEPF